MSKKSQDRDVVLAGRAALAAIEAAIDVIGKAEKKDIDRFKRLLAMALGVVLNDADAIDPRIGGMAARAYLRIVEEDAEEAVRRP